MAEEGTVNPAGDEPQTEPAAPETPPAQSGPSWEKAAEDYKKQRDEARAESAKLQKQLDDLNAKGDIDQLKQQLADQKAAADEAAKKADRDRVNIGRLAKENCRDIDLCLTLLDENGDVEALKKAKPYLFEEKTGTTGFKPSGSSTGDEFAKIDKAMGL